MNQNNTKMRKTTTLFLAMLATVAVQAQNESKKVYVPEGGTEQEQQIGAQRLRELLTEDGRWQVVESEAQADVVAEYRFSSKGMDHATLLLRDLQSGKSYESYRVSAHFRGPEASGKRSAETLYDRCILGGAYNDDCRAWAKDGFYKLHARFGAGVGVGAWLDHEPYLNLEGMAEYQFNSRWGIGAGIGYTWGFFAYPYSAISPQVEVISFFRKDSWHTGYLRLITGTNIPLSKYDEWLDFDFYYRGFSGTLGYGIQLRNNLCMELFAGVSFYYYERRGYRYDHLSSITEGFKSSFIAGGKLSYRIPIKSVR